MGNHSTVTEADIFADVIAPDEGGLNPETARLLLALKFTGETTKKIRQLLRKNNSGTITGEERAVLEKYLRVGQFLDLLHAKARLSLDQIDGDH
jgi:hypothetical protein